MSEIAPRHHCSAVRGVESYYGNIPALRGVDIDVHAGEIVTLIGANGAGKSTLMMTICGEPQARAGTITFAGEDITHLPTHEIARLRIAQSPEGRRIFPRMTVMENLQMGAVAGDHALFRAGSRSRAQAAAAPQRATARSAAARSPAASSRCSRSRAR